MAQPPERKDKGAPAGDSSSGAHGSQGSQPFTFDEAAAQIRPSWDDPETYAANIVPSWEVHEAPTRPRTDPVPTVARPPGRPAPSHDPQVVVPPHRPPARAHVAVDAQQASVIVDAAPPPPAAVVVPPAAFEQAFAAPVASAQPDASIPWPSSNTPNAPTHRVLRSPNEPLTRPSFEDDALPPVRKSNAIYVLGTFLLLGIVASGVGVYRMWSSSQPEDPRAGTVAPTQPIDPAKAGLQQAPAPAVSAVPPPPIAEPAPSTAPQKPADPPPVAAAVPAPEPAPPIAPKAAIPKKAPAPVVVKSNPPVVRTAPPPARPTPTTSKPQGDTAIVRDAPF
jgi:hypothetical protein